MRPFHESHPRARLHAANCFLVWRAGASVGWNCTASDIARETGLTPATVCRICRERGWRLESDSFQFRDRLPVDTAFRRNASINRMIA